jgi:hypothetical protein
MSRQWKKLPTHLPGWNYNISERTDGIERKRKKKKFKSRSIRQKIHQSFRSPKSNPSKPFSSSSVKEWILRISNDKVTLLSHWIRIQGSWRCIGADPQIEWFTRCSAQTVNHWLFANHFSKQWLRPHHLHGTAGEHSPATQVDRPLENQPPNSGYASPVGPITREPERNGVATSSALNCAGCPAEPTGESESSKALTA